MTGVPPSLRIQVVLFEQDLGRVWTLWNALKAVVRQGKLEDALGRVAVAIGDCSPGPILTDADVDALAASTDDDINSVSYEYFAENLGSAGGSNRLARSANEEFILVLNPDTYPAPTMLSKLLSPFSDGSIGAADCRQLPMEHPKDYDPVCGDTSWASGSCLLVRRAVYQAVEGFDAEHFFLYCDDVDFSWRVRLLGHRVVHVPDAVVFHDKRIQLGGAVLPTPVEAFYGTLGRLMLARRYDRLDILEQTLEFVGKFGTPDQQAAVDEWNRRAEADQVPAPMEGADRVAQFVGGEYARHRF